DLISLILYIHDNAMMSFSKGNETATVRTGSGIRQGQSALHGYGWKRGAGQSGRRAKPAQTTPTSTVAPSQASTDMALDRSSKREGDAVTGPEEGRAKWQRGQGKGTQRPKGKRSQQQSWWEKDRGQRGYSKSNEDLKNVVKALGRLVLRQEDSLSVMQLDCQFVIFMKNKPDTDQAVNWSITNQLLSVGNHWWERKAQGPKALRQPLRTVLFSSWLTAIKYRINEFTSNPSVKDQDPLTVADTLQTLDQLQKIIIHPNVIGRFHPLRKLTEGMVSDVIPWTLEIQNRTQEAQAAYTLIGRLVRNGCTHLAASTLRPSKLGRSPLAIAVDKMHHDPAAFLHYLQPLIFTAGFGKRTRVADITPCRPVHGLSKLSPVLALRIHRFSEAIAATCCATILPIEHFRFRILEEISEYLAEIGSSGENARVINTLALDFTRNLTGADLLAFTREVLPYPNARQVEARLALEYPLLHASILASISAWRPFVEEFSGRNDEYHDAYWDSLDFEKEKHVTSVSYELLRLQLHEQTGEETAELLLQSSFETLSGFNEKLRLLFRLMQQPLQKSKILEYAKLGKTSSPPTSTMEIERAVQSLSSKKALPKGQAPAGFADDLHMHWVLDEPRHFRNACAQVGYILADLTEMGMQ
ncbi:unnamed protein product, partial [Symbiodinium pilosum]